MRAFRRRAAELGTVLGLVATAVTALPVPAAHALNGACPPFVAVAAGENNSLALAADGTVWEWGWFRGTRPELVPGISGATAVASGRTHGLALVNGTVYSWGLNTEGQLGHGSVNDWLAPAPVPGLTGVTAIAAGREHSLAIAGGTVYAWGANAHGQLGDGTTVGRTAPVPVVGVTGATAIAAGDRHSLAIAGSGVKAWGDNGRGQLGDGTFAVRPVPITVPVPLAGVHSIGAGAAHSLAAAGGAVFAWGANEGGQLGDRAVGDSASVVPGPALAAGATWLAGGYAHSVAGTRTGVVTWGYGASGQLGDGTNERSDIGTIPSGLLAGATSVAAGWHHSLAVVGGAVKAWGYNGDGQLGTGGTTDSNVPVDVRCVVYDLTIEDVTDSPDPVPSGAPVVFAARWSAGRLPEPRLVVCRTATLSGSGCAGGTWAIGEATDSPVATAVRETSPADVGTHDYFAWVCSGDYCSGPLGGTFTVTPPDHAPAYVSDSCDVAGTNVVTGFVGDAYLKLRTQPAPDTAATWVCVAAESGANHVGGRLTIDGVSAAQAVAVDEDAAAVQACAADPNNVPVQSGTVLGGQPYWINATPAPLGSSDAAWVCVRFTDTLGFRLRFAPGGVGTATSFAADPPTPHTPAYAASAWPAAGPSASCAAAVGGRTRYVDVVVGESPVALYRWQEPTRTHLCVRGGGAGGAGGRLTVDGAGAPSLTSGTTTAPCPFDIVTRSDAPSYGVYVSDPASLPAVPVSACISVAGSARSVTLDYSGAAVATWSPDPA